MDEFIADTDPNASNEWFRITSVSNGVETIISFNSSSDRVYTLLEKTNLQDSVWMELLGPRIGIGGADSFDVGDNSDRMFYKLRVDLP